MSQLTAEELALFGPISAPSTAAPSKPKIMIQDIEEPMKVEVKVTTEIVESLEPAAVLPPDAPKNDANAVQPEKKRGRKPKADALAQTPEQVRQVVEAVHQMAEFGVTVDPAALKELKEQVALVSNLQTFLYILLRDHLTLGAVESIMQDHVAKAAGKRVLFSSAGLARCADDIAQRLTR